MRWNLKTEKKPGDKGPWTPWFVWRPINIKKERVWWEKVERRKRWLLRAAPLMGKNVDMIDYCYDYRFINE